MISFGCPEKGVPPQLTYYTIRQYLEGALPMIAGVFETYNRRWHRTKIQLSVL